MNKTINGWIKQVTDEKNQQWMNWTNIGWTKQVSNEQNKYRVNKIMKLVSDDINENIWYRMIKTKIRWTSRILDEQKLVPDEHNELWMN